MWEEGDVFCSPVDNENPFLSITSVTLICCTSTWLTNVVGSLCFSVVCNHQVQSSGHLKTYHFRAVCQLCQNAKHYVCFPKLTNSSYLA